MNQFIFVFVDVSRVGATVLCSSLLVMFKGCRITYIRFLCFPTVQILAEGRYRISQKSSTVIYEVVTKFPPQIHQFPSMSLVAFSVGCPWQPRGTVKYKKNIKNM